MSKSTFIIGMLVAAAAHAALLWPLDRPTTAAEDTKPDVKPPTVAVLPEVPKVETPPPPPKPEPPAPLPAPKPVEPAPLKRVVEAPPEPDAPEAAGETSADGPADVLPPLRVVWESADQLRTVAAHLGMRIVAVNADNQVAGEVATSGAVRIVPFEGRLSSYSNRVRTLPRGFFGSGPVADSDVASFWVLVPADLDARFVLLQRDAIRREGLTPAEVRAMDAEFRSGGSGYQLVITRLVRE